MKRSFPLLLLLPFFFQPVSAGATPAFPSPDSLPPLELLEQSALTRAGINPDKIQRWQRQARVAVALPRLQVGYEQGDQQNNTAIIQDSLSVTSAGITIGPESNRVDQDFRNDRGFEVRAVWALDELLFNRNELDISREARDLTLLRGRLQEELRDTYFLLKTQLWQFQANPNLRSELSEVILAQRNIARLDSLSGGTFLRLAPEFRLPLPSPLTAIPSQEKEHGPDPLPAPQSPNSPSSAVRAPL